MSKQLNLVEIFEACNALFKVLFFAFSFTCFAIKVCGGYVDER